jgi:hypothetical protein
MKIIYLLLVFLPLTAHAELSFEEVTTRSVSDLMYLPEAGTWVAEATISKDETDSTLTVLGLNFDTESSEDLGTSLEFGRVLEGDMMATIVVPYLIENKSTTNFGPASTLDGTSSKTKAKGLGDVDLKFKWRLLSQDKSKVDVDLKVNVSPKTGSAKSASTTREGNNFRGGTNYGFGFEAGKKLKSLQFSTGANLNFNGKRKQKSLTTDDETTVTSFSNLSLEASVQLQPNDKFFINAGVLLVGESDFSDSTNGSTTNYDVDGYVQLAVAVGYKFSEAMALRVLYTDASVDRTIVSGSNTFTQKIEASSLGANLQIQF